MKRERLIRVRDESELRVGMIVVVKNCEGLFDAGYRHNVSPCPGGGRHRFMLMPRAEPCASCGGRQFMSAPSAHEASGVFCFAADCTAWIDDGDLYRVQDGLEADTQESRPAKRPRVREGAR